MRGDDPYLEKKYKLRKKKNEWYLYGFYKWLKNKDLSLPEIKDHILNMQFYICEFLLYYEIKAPAQGIYHIQHFMNQWYIEKTLKPTKENMKKYCQGFKYFYKYLMEIEEIKAEDYRQMKNKIDSRKDDWFDKLNYSSYSEDLDPINIWPSEKPWNPENHWEY